MKSIPSIIPAIVTILLLTYQAASAQECSPLYGQCGGTNFAGPSCCEQPQPDRYVSSYPQDAVICNKLSEAYSQCQPRCPPNEPCLVQNSRCSASIEGASDGRGRQYCGVMTACTNSAFCFSNPFSCVCGGSKPCALTTRPGGCAAPRPDPSFSKANTCGPALRRCPGFEGDQCGGTGHIEPTTCQPGLKCVKESDKYSACRPL